MNKPEPAFPGIILQKLIKLKLKLQGGYNAGKYWRERFIEYGFDPRGVGNKSLSADENRRQYHKATETLISLCRQSDIEFQNAAVLDIGCGNGFYTQLLNNLGCTDYTGVDITDVLFSDLKKRFPSFQFIKCDITNKKLSGRYDFIIMIDVTQHITSERKFNFALNNIRDHMKANSLFIVTSFLKENLKNSFYEKSRAMRSYKQIFNSETFSRPQKFRDKFIFCIQGK